MISIEALKFTWACSRLVMSTMADIHSAIDTSALRHVANISNMIVELQQAPDDEVHHVLIRALHRASHLPDGLLYKLHAIRFPFSLEAIPILSCHHALELHSQVRDALLAAIKLQ